MLVCLHIPLFTRWLKEARDAGTRVLMVIDGPDELEELMAPPGLKEAVVHAGQRLERAKTMRITRPGRHRPHGQARRIPDHDPIRLSPRRPAASTIGAPATSTPSRTKARPTAPSCSQPGDIVVLPYCRYVQDEVRLDIRDGFIRKIEGGLDAKLMSDWLDGNRAPPDDMDGHAIFASRLGAQSAGALGRDRAQRRRSQAPPRRRALLCRQLPVLHRAEFAGRRQAHHQGPLRRADARLHGDPRQRRDHRARQIRRREDAGGARRALRKPMTHPAASATGITKQFGATRALDGVDFDVMPGEIHALVGENGAGKSTLVRILGGVHRPDAGEIAVDGASRRFSSPRDAIAAGIVTIPQELRLVPALSIAENIALGDLPVRRVLGLAAGGRSRPHARGGPRGARAARFCARSRPARRAPELRRAPARRHRQGAAPALPRVHPRRADRRAGEARDRAPVLGACAHEGAGHGDRLRLASPRRGGGARRPLHRAARRPGRGDEPARRVQRRRPHPRHDRAARRPGPRARSAPARCCWKMQSRARCDPAALGRGDRARRPARQRRARRRAPPVRRR